MQLAAWVGEQKSRRCDVEQSRALLGEFGQQLNHVEVIKQAIHQGDNRAQHASFAR
jgi:hypothetical protein